jgi:Skp family chaperone for outer membrane proteins
MLERQMKIVALFALVGLGIWWCASAGRAAGRDEGKPLVGVVDMETISDKGEPFRAERDAFQKLQEEMDKELTARVFMSPEEVKQLEDILDKPKRTPDDDKKYKALVEEGLKRDKERSDLEGKANKTAQELARLRELQTLLRRNRDDVAELARQYQAKLQKDNADARQRLIEQVKKATEQVGSKKGYALVVPKDIALWSNNSIDVTNDVLGALNSKK